MTRRLVSKVLLAAVVAGAPMVLPCRAHAFDFSLKVDPAVAIPLDDTLRANYKVGGAVSLRALFGVVRFMDVQIGGMFVGLAPGATGASASTMWATGGGLRFKRPWDARGAHGLQPWIDGNLDYVRIDERDRFGFDVGAGLNFPIGKRRKFAIGPYVRYFQVVERDGRPLPVTGGTSETDPKIFMAGLSFEGRLIDRRSWRKVNVDSDRDGDGIIDIDDRCPDVSGPAETQGCPTYTNIVVGTTRLEVAEALRFDVDKSTIQPESYPLLDELAKIMRDNPSFQLRVAGNTDSTGTDEHNVQLGVARATAVIEYLAQHGVARLRMAPRSFGSTRPVDTNSTAAGRQDNRRDEFYITRPELE